MGLGGMLVVTVIVFQHIPKTGGTSVAKGMQQALGLAALSCANDSDLVVRDASELAKYSFIYGHVSTRSIEYCLPNADVLLCVRDPVERVLSQYFDWRMKHTRDVEIDKASRYRAIIDTSIDVYDDLLRCLGDYSLPTYSELRDRQVWQLGDHALDRTKNSAEILNCAKRAVERAFIVGLYEGMEAFLASIANSKGLGVPVPSYRLNVTEGRPRAVEIPASVRNAIEQVNTLDLALYDFVRTLVERRGEGDARADRKLEFVVAPTDLGESNGAKWPRPAILENHDYRDIAGWVPDGIVEILARLFRHQRIAAPDSVLLEFRPFHGQYLVALGSLLPATTAIYGIDTSEDRAAYPDSLGCHRACVAAVQQFFGTERVEVFPRKPIESEGKFLNAPEGGIRMGIISRPFSALDVIEELEWLDRFVTPDGMVLVNDFLNSSWIQVNDGAMRYISGQRGQLVPFMLCYGHLLLCRPDLSFHFRERARGIPHFYGCALLDIGGFECVKT
jgi:Sulfotransferase family